MILKFGLSHSQPPSPTAAQAWIAGNAAQLQQSYIEQRAAAQELAKATTDLESATVVKQGKAGPAQPESWLSKIPLVGGQLSSLWQDSPAAAFVQEKIYQPYLQPYLNTKTIVSTVVAAALAIPGVQWGMNLVTAPDVFGSAQAQAQGIVAELQEKYPPDPATATLGYLFEHPYDALSEGTDIINGMLRIGAGYADAVWGQNPVVQGYVLNTLALEEFVCSGVSDPAWHNRCTGSFYLNASLAAQPFDTAEGVASALVVSPVEGVIEQIALSYETLRDGLGVIEAVQEGGLQAGGEYLKGLFDRNLYVLLNDPQVQSAVFLEVLLLVALIPFFGLPVAGGIVAGTTIKGLIDLDAILAQLPTKESVAQFVSSHEVRTAVVSSVVVLGLVITAMGIKGAQFDAFREGMSPWARLAFEDLSPIEQARVFNAAQSTGVAPEALDYYVLEKSAPGSALSTLSVSDGLFVSELAVQSGRGALLLDYVGRYGVTDALRLATPEVIRGMTSDSILLQTEWMLKENAGYSVSPEHVFTSFPEIGSRGTYITSAEAIRAVIGDFEGRGTIRISAADAMQLEASLGLTPGSFSDGIVISRIVGISDMSISYPIDGNTSFLGPGKGLPGGGPELTISPSLPVDSPFIIEQTVIEVMP